MIQATGLDVVTVGEAMVLFAAQQAGPLDQVEAFTRGPAGAELNVAVGLARLGLHVAYVSRLGRDAFGRYLAAAMQGEGIDCSHVAFDAAHPTGFMLKARTHDGDPQTEYFRRGSAASQLGPADHPRARCAASRHLHVTGISVAVSPSVRELVFEMAAEARAGGRSVSLDPNLRPGLWPSQAAMVECINALAAHCDWVLPGLAEGRLLTGCTSAEAIAAHYLERGASVVAVKLGPEGAYFASRARSGYVPGVAVAQVIDTVGAGDGFAVGLISGLLEGLTLDAAVGRGCRIGARVVQFPGDSDGLPTRAELESA